MITKIKNYPNYGVDENGNVYSLPRQYKPKLQKLKPRANNKGYLQVQIYNEFGVYKALIHRLVAETFIPNPKNKPEVNHKDGNKNDNSVNNLEWVTRKENVQNAIERGTAYQNMSGFDNHRGKLIAQYDINGKLIKIWPSTRSIEYELGFAHPNIIKACKKNLVRYGFKWKYYEGVETK